MERSVLLAYLTGWVIAAAILVADVVGRMLRTGLIWDSVREQRRVLREGGTVCKNVYKQELRETLGFSVMLVGWAILEGMLWPMAIALAVVHGVVFLPIRIGELISGKKISDVGQDVIEELVVEKIALVIACALLVYILIAVLRTFVWLALIGFLVILFYAFARQ